MIKVKMGFVLSPDQSDPLSGERLTTAVIYDGEREMPIRVVCRDSRRKGCAGWLETQQHYAAALIAEGYRLGKEAR